jgi:hypothetical protein
MTTLAPKRTTGRWKRAQIPNRPKPACAAWICPAGVLGGLDARWCVKRKGKAMSDSAAIAMNIKILNRFTGASLDGARAALFRADRAGA